MRKITASAIFLTAFLLQSCLNYTQVTTIKTDGSGEMFIHYWTYWTSEEDSVIFQKLGIFNPDSIRHEFSSKFNEISNVEVYRDYSDSTIHAKVEFTFSQIDSLNQMDAFKGANFSIVDGPEKTKIFSQFVAPFATGFGINTDQFNFRYIYYLPGNIIKYNAQSLSNNKLTWEFNLSQIGMGKQISATYIPFRLKQTPVWIYILALIVILVVIIFLFKKK